DCVVPFSLASFSVELAYSISEEVNKGTVVGNLAKDLNINVQELENRDLRLVSSYSKTYLNVNLRSGNLLNVWRHILNTCIL
uniref:Cadherin N-terminal domain-containing protein n=1 Tax=Neolamprologus brichardi TaxID=32507 RepID=A0A3Q4GQK7_NEOBR